MKHPALSHLLTAALIAAVALTSCKKQDEPQAEAKDPVSTPAPKPAAEEVAVQPTAVQPTAITNPPARPAEESPFEPGGALELVDDEKAITEELLAALPETPQSDVLKEGIALSDRLLAAMEGAKSAPEALAALEALDPEFVAVAERMKSLGPPPEEETREQFGEVLRSMVSFDMRIRAAMKNLTQPDPSLPADQARRQASLVSAQLYRASSKLIGHYQTAWPSISSRTGAQRDQDRGEDAQ